jgi:hypothetical protein
VNEHRGSGGPGSRFGRGRRFAAGLVGVVALVGIGASPAFAGGNTTWEISTVAGNGSEGNGLPAASTSFAYPTQLAVDANGNVLIADTFGQKVRVFAATSGTFYGASMTAHDTYNLAGDGTSGAGSDGVPATVSGLTDPAGVALDSSGNVVISDTEDNRIQVVAESTGTFYGQAMTAGDAYTVAGNGDYGYSGNASPATSAEVALPGQIGLDTSGNLIVADTENNRVRVVAETTGTFYGHAMTAGDIYTVAGNGTSGYNGNGVKATSAELSGPESARVDPAGNLVINDNGNDRVRVVAESTGTFYGHAMTAGDIYTVAGNGIHGYTGNGVSGTAAELNENYYSSASVDPSGNIVVNDTDNGVVRVVAGSTGTFYGHAMTAGDIYTVAGDGTLGETGNGGLATRAELGYTDSSAFDASGNIIVDDGLNIRVVAATTGTFYGQSMVASHIYALAGNDTGGYTGDGAAATLGELNGPFGVTLGPSGSIVIGDSNNRVVRMEPASSGTYYGQSMTAGDIYTVAGTGVYGDAGNGGPATAAWLTTPAGEAIDASGNLLIDDTNSSQVRVVAASTGTFYGQSMTAGDIYALAGTGTYGDTGIGGPAVSAQAGCPEGVAVDHSGNVVIADPCDEQIFAVAATTGTFYGQAMTSGDLYSIAGNGTSGHSGNGGPATAAEFGKPTLLAVDAAGNLIVPDATNNQIRVVAAATGTYYGVRMTAGDIYLVAGNGTAGYLGDGARALSAELNHPDGVAVDSSGNLVITDSHNNVVRVIAVRSGTYYGVSMTAGDIYTVAGNGTSGYSGDGGSPTSAEIALPVGVTTQAGGAGGDTLYVADAGNSRIREVSQ